LSIIFFHVHESGPVRKLRAFDHFTTIVGRAAKTPAPSR
jgi:hypothetical protein